MNLSRLLILAILLPCILARRHSRPKRDIDPPKIVQEARNWSRTFDSTFPEQLRDGFKRCRSIPDEGDRGICKLLAAMDSQLKILKNTKNHPAKSELSNPSCRFKSENGKSLHRYASDGSPELQSLLDRYTEMHRECVARERDNLKNFYERRSDSDRPVCRYIVWSCTFGLGNRIMSLVSTFLYAILSQRILLLEESDSWNRLFCEPFESSRWRTPPGMALKDDQSPGFTDFYTECGGQGDSCKTHLVVPIVFSADTRPEEHRFLVCPSAMASVRNVPILNFRNSNQYFALGFFMNPALRPVLETIFRDRKVFHNLARFLLNPSDPVWKSIKEIDRKRFRSASRRIGVQLRESKGEYRDYYDESVRRCIRTKSGLCPIEVEEFQESGRKEPSEDFFTVYVASLIGEHSSKINASLREIERETGQRFELAMQDADEEQIDDVEHQQKALVDMWALSMADVLMTSHMSTFGYTAQGLAGVTPYLLKPWKENPCWLGVSSDPCFHFAPSKSKVSCVDDGYQITDNNMLFMPCPDLPNTGLQLVEP